MADPREDVQVFAREVLRRPLWAHQVDVARSPAFITTIAAARRSGKTTLIETLAAWTAFRDRGVRVVVLSATQDAARRVTEGLNAVLAGSRLTSSSVVDDFVMRIRLDNGSEIVSLPASSRQVRGYGRDVRLVVIDEAGFVPSELWVAASYVALDEKANGSRILLAGTPWGGAEHFFRQHFERGRDGDPDVASFHWTYEANPLLDHAYLERQRDRVSPAEFAAEVLGEWSDAAGSLFPRELLERQTADVVLPELGELSWPARPILALDYGVSFDRSAAVVVYRLPSAALNAGLDRPVFVVIPHVWPVRTPLMDVVSDVVGLPIDPRFLASEVNGVGAMPSQELVARMPRRGLRRTWATIATTSQTKTAGYGAILGLLERGQLVLPRHPELLRQLAGLRFEQGERGFTRINAEDPAVHDDVADALYLAALPYRPRGGGRVVCELARLAGPARAVEEPDVPELEEPVVETGGGLRVYRRPPLQSVAGLEVSMPARVRVAQRSARAPRPQPPNPVVDSMRAAVQAALSRSTTEGSSTHAHHG